MTVAGRLFVRGALNETVSLRVGCKRSVEGCQSKARRYPSFRTPHGMRSVRRFETVEAKLWSHRVGLEYLRPTNHGEEVGRAHRSIGAMD